MAFEFRTRRRIEFAETDMAGIVHFTNFFRYMEEAEHAFLRSLGLSVTSKSAEGGAIGFPRLAASCEYLRPARFEDTLDIHLWVSRKGRTSLTYAAVFSKDGAEVARGQSTCVACRILPGGTIEAVPLPESVASRIEEAPYPPPPGTGRPGGERG